jgi:ATP-dependent RNA helicase DDX31/DBP7
LGRKGQAIIFLSQCELGYVQVLGHHGINLELVPLPRVLAALRPPRTAGSAATPIKRDDGPPPGARLQKQFVSMVSSNEELQALAGEAFRCFLRAYAAYPKNLKNVFHPKKLHLGHVANSFALTQPPSRVYFTSPSPLLFPTVTYLIG